MSEDLVAFTMIPGSFLLLFGISFWVKLRSDAVTERFTVPDLIPRTDLQTLFDKSCDLWAVVTPRGEFYYLNGAWVLQFGYPLQALGQRSLLTLSDTETQPIILNVLQAWQRGDAIAPFKTRHTHAEGHSFWLQWHPVRTATPERLWLRVEDVTPAAPATETLLLTALPDLILRCQEDGTIVAAYPAQDQTGFLAEQWVGQSMQQVLPEELAAEVSTLIALALSTQTVQTLTYQAPQAGQLRDYEARFSAVQGLEVVVVVRDVTAHQASLRDRDQAYHQLHARLHQQAIVAKLGQKALAAADLNCLMDAAVRLATQTLGVQFGYVLEQVESQQAFLLRAGQGWRQAAGQTVMSAGQHSYAGYTLAVGQPVIITNVQTETRFGITPLLQEHQIQAGVNVMIAGPRGQRAFGVFGVHSDQPRSFTEHDTHFLQAIAHVLSTAIDRQQADERLRLMERAISASHNGVILTNATQADNPVIYANPAFERMTGYPVSEILGQNCARLQGPDTQPEAIQIIRDAIRDQRDCAVTLRNYRKDGTPFWNQLFIAPVFNDQGEVTHFVGIQNDVTQRYQAELALQASEAKYRRIVETAAEGIWILDELNLTSFVNTQMAEMLGYTPDEMIGRSFFDFMAADSRAAAQQPFTALQQSTVESHDFLFKRRDGTDFWALIASSPLVNEAGDYLGVLGMVTDITDRKQAETQLAHFAFYDTLTDLPNRAYFCDRLQDSINAYQADPTAAFAVFFLDLDGFKMVNDGLGHTVGDHLLVAIAHRLQNVLDPSYLLARLGGDEFTLLIPHLYHDTEVVAIAQRIHDLFQQPFTIDHHTIFSNASIGIALSHPHYHHPEELLRDADTAMYHAKANGKGNYALFNPAMHNAAVERLQLETDLRLAIEQNQFALAYQPIVCLTSGKLLGFEALLRWHHPDRGLISPDQFIPVAEETRLILAIGAWVMAEACHQLRRWQDRWGTDLDITININLSAKQFTQPNFLQQIDTLLEHTQINPRLLKLEITEGAIMEDPHTAQITFQALKQRGLQLSIDDFGTGYSSLSYLHHFPLDTLKIDRSFIQPMQSPGEASEIVKTIMTLAHNLGMTVVAEGVENVTQLNYLKTLGCEYGQGYFWSRPLPATLACVMLQQACLRTDASALQTSTPRLPVMALENRGDCGGAGDT
jgi:diguanylate cyclase (GGDEF)-like protein/PAS domain S-box-containing protein